MALICLIPPPGELESTLRGLRMHILPEHFDVTDQLRLGGEFSQALRGPTPAALVPDGLVPASVIPDPGVVRPVHTKPSAMADDPNNYRT